MRPYFWAGYVRGGWLNSHDKKEAVFSMFFFLKERFCLPTTSFETFASFFWGDVFESGNIFPIDFAASPSVIQTNPRSLVTRLSL